jgi:hypothetical protein
LPGRGRFLKQTFHLLPLVGGEFAIEIGRQKMMGRNGVHVKIS